MLRIGACLAALSCALLMPLAAQAASTQKATPCGNTHVKRCATKAHQVAVTSMYYQNASKVGGTALAGYPELQASYGVTQQIQTFYDPPSELAISSHGGHYVMAHPGLGIEDEIAQDGAVSFTLTAQSHPQLTPLANLYLVPLADVHLAATWANASQTDFAAEVGTLNFSATNRSRRRSSMFDAVSATETVAPRTWVTGELGTQSNATYGSAGETRAIASVGHALGANALFNVDLGTTFNAMGDSKPHYLGAGFTVLR